MTIFAWALVLAAAVPSPTPAPASPRLAELSAAVRDADYRGDRARLEKLDAELAALPEGALAEYRDYWRGFARWRRAMNGFNETPTPGDLGSDLETALARFRESLEKRPDWIEARLARVGCWGNLLFLSGGDVEKTKAILAVAVPDFRWLVANAGDNPRALWIKGGIEFGAPPPNNDPAKAVVTLRHGVACAWRETLSSAGMPSWVPTWGGPENLMNLAYLYSHGPAPDRAAALAYAEGALTSVPEWHYVRDVLLPQIEALPTAVAAK